MWRYILVTLFVAAPIPLFAQNPYTFDPLALPGQSAIICRDIPPTAADSADVVLHFVDDGIAFRDRETVVAYSSTGAVLYLTLTAIDSVEGKAGVFHGYAIRFVPTAGGGHIVQGSDETDGGQEREATEEELKRAIALAEKFWEMRCRPKPASIKPPPALPLSHRFALLP